LEGERVEFYEYPQCFPDKVGHAIKGKNNISEGVNMKKIIMLIMVSTISTIMIGCATYSWYHPSKNIDEFNQDKYVCIRQSAQAFPVVIQQQSYGTGYTNPSLTTCTTNYGQTDCITIPGTYEPPPSIAVDVNEGNRNAAFNSCMNARGWSLIRNK
jgi:hypothetical protein